MVKIKNKKTFIGEMSQHRKIQCPRCSGLLRKNFMRKIRHPSGAILDVCDNCGGMWLDRNEVKLLYNYSKKSRGRKK